MKSDCLKYQENLSALIDKQLLREQSEDTRRHMEKCTRCKQLYQLLSTLQRKIRTELICPAPPEHLDGNLRFYLQNQRKKKVVIRSSLQQKIAVVFSKKWAFAVEFALVFCLAVVAGIKLYPFVHKINENHFSLGPTITPTSQNTLENSLRDFIEQSSKVLLQIKNGEPGISYEQEQKLAAKLITSSKLVSRTIDRENAQYFNLLLNELEPVFIDIAHLDQPSLEVVQKAIDKKELILKLACAKSLNENYAEIALK